LGASSHRLRSAWLVLRYRRGDDSAMEEMVALWERPLYYFVRRLVRSEEDAWDALQEVWCQVVRKIGQLRDPQALATWLYQIAHNAAVSGRRRQPALEPLPADDDPGMADDGEDHWLPTLDARAIHEALAELSLPHREVLTLRFLEDFSLGEIAEITGITLGTVKSRLHYAKQAIREILQRKGHQP
jgi:RNA polymerase sigma-70 factor, ECF subfamily